LIASSVEDSRWENLQNMYRRFVTDEISGARVRARFQNVEREIVTNREGCFDLEPETADSANSDALFQKIELELF